MLPGGLLLRALLSPYSCRAFWNSSRCSSFPCCSPLSSDGVMENGWGGDRGFIRQRSALLQTTGTCKGPPSIMTAPRCQSATPSLPFSATCDQQSCPRDGRQACHSGWRLQIYACWHMCLKGCFYSGSVWSKQASAGSFSVGPFFYLKHHNDQKENVFPVVWNTTTNQPTTRGYRRTEYHHKYIYKCNT